MFRLPAIGHACCEGCEWFADVNIFGGVVVLGGAGLRHRVGENSLRKSIAPNFGAKAIQCDLLLSARVHVGLPAPPIN